MTLGQKIQMLIADRGTSQAAVARRAGISQPRLSRIINGERNARLFVAQALAIARALEVSLDYLADDAATAPPPAVPTAGERRVWEVVREIGPERAWKRLIQGAAGEHPAPLRLEIRETPEGPWDVFLLDDPEPAIVARGATPRVLSPGRIRGGIDPSYDDLAVGGLFKDEILWARFGIGEIRVRPYSREPAEARVHRFSGENGA
jgi:transcriptional regulator with XRE-family HTH domain